MRLHSAQCNCNLHKFHLLRPCSKEASTLLGQTLEKPWKGLFETGLFLVCNHVTGLSCWLTKQNKTKILLLPAVEKRSLSYQRKWFRDFN